jgi:hypothetical protein
MGYIIQNIDIIKTVVTIPQADVQIMDNTAPITLVATNNLFYALPIACFIKIEANQTTPYTGFTHVHLCNSANPLVGELSATFAENATLTGLRIGEVYSMLCAFQSAPNRFGGSNAFKPLNIQFDIIPTAGDGDMIVTLYYTRITI